MNMLTFEILCDLLPRDLFLYVLWNFRGATFGELDIGASGGLQIPRSFILLWVFTVLGMSLLLCGECDVRDPCESWLKVVWLLESSWLLLSYAFSEVWISELNFWLNILEKFIIWEAFSLLFDFCVLSSSELSGILCILGWESLSFCLCLSFNFYRWIFLYFLSITLLIPALPLL